jgi:hypothetical protein
MSVKSKHLANIVGWVCALSLGVTWGFVGDHPLAVSQTKDDRTAGPTS